ncbi:LacI family DNA-binding transcriptional regulator [Pseudolysinimonas sp.]|uniref:LacI family DNA-binding transcriptional regulator n=1 Tax=Pseudolysinimonas sp. TaxID=2680009 RepID=UPI003F7FC509
MNDARGPVAEPARAATIYDVARLAGVSHATVTRMLRGFEGIRPETRERVQHALDTLDYRPNLTARSLITGRSHRVGAVMHEFEQVGPSRIVQGAARAARQAGYVLDIVTLDATDRASIEESLELMTQHDLAGIIVFASTDDMAEAYAQARFRVPVELSIDEDGGASVEQSIGRALDRTVARLAALGHRRLVHIAGPPGWVAARNREAFYRTAVERHGLESAATIAGDWSSASGYAAVAQLPPDVTAIVASNDQMALGALRGLEEHGVRVPEDVSVTGVDDIPEAAYLRPPLSTVRLDFLTQGEGVFLRLLKRIDPAAAAGPGVPTEPTALFIERGSTGPAPAPRR